MMDRDVYCPNCISFEVDCNPNPEDYSDPCDRFQAFVDFVPVGNSLRDQMKDMIRGYLADYHHISESEVDCDMVADLADIVFDVMMVDDEVQDSSYKEFQSRRELILTNCQKAEEVV